MGEVFLGADRTARDVRAAVKVAHAKYDFSVDGGVTGAITPKYTETIPKGAMIGGYLEVLTAIESLGSATLAIGTTAGSAANSLLTATAKATLVIGYKAVLAPTTPVPVAMSAAGLINVTVGTADLTAGVVDIYVYYI